MPKRNYDDWQRVKELTTMGQELSSEHPAYKQYMGADIELAKTIAILNVLEQHGKVDPAKTKLLKDLLIEQNRATFASSEKTDNLTKISLGLGKEEMPAADGSL